MQLNQGRVNTMWVLIMILIREVVHQAISSGYLSVAAEERLRHLLKTKYGLEDLDAFMNLQEAVIAGKVRQESRESRDK